MIVFAAGALSVAFADPPASGSIQTQEAARNEQDNRRICRRESVTGSRTGRPVCHTRADWARINAGEREAARRTLNNSDR